jgi:hypothetical protein
LISRHTVCSPCFCIARNVMAEPLTDAYLQQCEWDARRFSGAYTGTSGTLAAHVMRLLAELSRVKGELAVERARRQDS